ncbi:MAG: hypothetical protein JWN86_3679 [Planctomycetota bacterium]|nr:hypothetical protein [Planctomycetota bacterium]
MLQASSRSSRHRFLLVAFASLVLGCATVKPPAATALLPTQHQTRTGPYCVFTNAAMPPDAPAIRSLQSLERQLEATLGIRVPPGTEPIEVYILESPEAFRHFLMFYFPELPTRRAFFLAQGTRRVVYTYQGGRLEEDLRHEATHALLHAAAPELPLWLDEGLAEYFEGDEARDGLNAEHLAHLPDDFESGFIPDLKRLESLRDVRKMTPRDYRESWAWVHYLLNGPASGKAALLSFLADQRGEGDPSPLSRRLIVTDSDPAIRLISHVEHTREASLAAARALREREPTVRFQDRAEDVAPVPPQGKRRSFFGRITGLFGM